MVQAVVFDFDGTLVTTEEAEFASWSQLYREYGAELALSEWTKCVGQAAGTWSAYDHLCDITGHRHDEQLVVSRRFALLEAELEHLMLMPGAEEMIALLQEHKVPMAIASNSLYDWVEVNLERIGRLTDFPVIMSRDRASRPKPAPAPYLEACQLLGADPAAAIAFEDSNAGLTSAHHAGLHTVAIPNPITAHMDFSLADEVVGSLTEYLPRLRAML